MASTGTYAPDPDLHVVDANGLPVSGGLVWTYIAGTTTPVATYTDVALTTPNGNPIVAGSDGRFVAFLAPGNAYKFVYETAATPPAHGAVLATRDNITAIPLSSPSTDITGTAGELLTQGQVVYLSSGLGGKTPGQWYLADADFDYASSTASTVGIVVNTALAGTQALVRLAGQIAIPGVTLTPGASYWVSQTAGAVTGTTPPVVPPAYTRFLGTALDVATLALTVPANVALLNAPNTFTSPTQTIAATNANLVLRDTSQGADAKVFRILNNSQLLGFSALNDAQTVTAATPLQLDRTGAAKVGTDIYEKGRTTPIGHWIDVPFNAANFAHAPSGTALPITAGQIGQNHYTLIGKTLIWTLQISNCSLTVAGTTGIWLVTPFGSLRASFSSTGLFILNGASTGGFIQAANSTTFSVARLDQATMALGPFYLYITIIASLN